ncbi:MAG: amidophosphoribosyltransferase [Candidatus Marinimicrobia bacterium]|nr:amidophosphoribosyltransferase [Candidatus Neomarinimicrobiota bacterium]|tara:strand:- start:3118 stop:4578 length:1461 start_codon:yes stop_codon:yes gene_type:complete
MCAILGLVTDKDNASLTMYNALTVLQHRGQDAAGMATLQNGNNLNIHKDNGLVRDVFNENSMISLKGNIGVGHTRYPTAGSYNYEEAQPFYVNSPYGIVLVHNGNIVNVKQLREEIEKEDYRHLKTSSDSEVILNIFAHALQENKSLELSKEQIFKAVDEVHRRVQGAYSVIIMLLGHGLIAFRDPHGIRPLIYGSKSNNKYMVASESVALDCLGYKVERDIKPGETIFIDMKNDIHFHHYNQSHSYSPCIFEYVYLARPDSVIDGINVYQSRLEMGKKLANKIKQDLTTDELDEIDVVIPIPDTSKTSALPLSIELNKKLREGFIKNRYIGRTFIMPGQKVRKKSVKQKLNTINLEFENRVVLLIDDSIVRGNTSKQIIQMARDAGAKKVYFASASPPIRYPNVYGIDMPYVNELVAHDRTVDQIKQEIGADKLIYQSLDDLKASVKKYNPEIDTFDCSCFNGEYITEGVSVEYLKKLKDIRKSN